MEQNQTDDPPHPSLCCCPPRALLWGSTRSVAVALTNQMQEDENTQFRHDVNVTVTGGTSVDGSGGGQHQTMLRKDIDAVCLTATYELSWRVEASCMPVAVSLELNGVLVKRLACLDVSGTVAFSKVTPYQYKDLVNRVPARLVATLRALDCAGHRVECSIDLEEP